MKSPSPGQQPVAGQGLCYPAAAVSESGKARSPSIRRNEGGTRHEASRRVELRAGPSVLTGWTLNLSRGGARIVLIDEEVTSLIVGISCTVEIDGDPLGPRRASVIWIQNEPDGQIAGVKFLDVEGSTPPP